MNVTETVKGVALTYREGTHDRYIIERVVVENVYGLEADLSGKTVIDIGAHIGSFAVLAANRGARVFAFEPERENFALLCENCRAWPRISPMQLGVRGEWRDALCRVNPSPDVVNVPLHIHPKNSGCHSFHRSDWMPEDRASESETQAVPTVTLQHVFSRLVKSAGVFLKVDCEGSEIAILRDIMDPDLGLLDGIDAMGVEFHSPADLDWAIPCLERWFYASPVSQWEWRFVKRAQ